MKRIFIALFLLLAATPLALAQAAPERRIIEVTGSAETLVTPNEFTFRITLVERIENKQKLTIETQEANLKRELAALGIDVAKDLTIFDLESVYIARKKTKDTLAAKDYRLKLHELDKIEKLQDLADRLNIANLALVESTHTELTRLRKETKMEAIKAAKAKAEYLLGAIGERVGKAVFIQEIPDETESRNFGYTNSNSNIRISAGLVGVVNEQQDTTLSFSKIKLRYAVLARFEIE
ncbi:MAG: SIMPL domain-containing protein [Acidobacteria bacterium]|nr:SIMPL domain-containing protein [Acidobacteriota bacterium]